MDQTVPTSNTCFCCVRSIPRYLCLANISKWFDVVPGGCIEHCAAAPLMYVLDRYRSEVTIFIEYIHLVDGSDEHTGRGAAALPRIHASQGFRPLLLPVSQRG